MAKTPFGISYFTDPFTGRERPAPGIYLPDLTPMEPEFNLNTVGGLENFFTYMREKIDHDLYMNCLNERVTVGNIIMSESLYRMECDVRIPITCDEDF